MKEYSKHLFHSLVRYCEELQCDCEIDNAEGEISLLLDIRDDTNAYHATFVVSPIDITLLCFSPYCAEPPQYAAAVQFMNRVNYRMYGCKLDMSYDDGSITMTCNGMCNNEPISQERIHFMVNTVIENWALYAKGLIHVLFADANPKEVIDNIEREGS